MLSIRESATIRKQFSGFVFQKGTEPNTIEIKPPSQEEALNMELSMRKVCIGCFAMYQNCSGFKRNSEDDSRAATVSLMENQEGASEKLLAIEKADRLAPCGLLATALAMLS